LRRKNWTERASNKTPPRVIAAGGTVGAKPSFSQAPGTCKKRQPKTKKPQMMRANQRDRVKRWGGRGKCRRTASGGQRIRYRMRLNSYQFLLGIRQHRGEKENKERRLGHARGMPPREKRWKDSESAIISRTKSENFRLILKGGRGTNTAFLVLGSELKKIALGGRRKVEERVDTKSCLKMRSNWPKKRRKKPSALRKEARKE